MLAALIERFRRRAAVPSRDSADSSDAASRDDRRAARSLKEAIDRALNLGLWSHADRLVASASRISSAHPGLTESIARLRLAQSDAKTALSVIESCQRETASLRLLRMNCLIELGRKAEAAADLYRWSQRSTAPLDARLMLAFLEWEAGDHHAAMNALLRNLRFLEDPRTLELLVLMTAAAGRQELAARWAKRLQRCHMNSAHTSEHVFLLRSLLITLPEAVAEPQDEQVETLAMELVLAEPVIPALVEAQRRRPRRSRARLLLRAIQQALPELSDQSAAYEALAKLSVVLNNQDAAHDWAKRALELNPMSASLALLLEELPKPPAGETRSPSPAIVASIVQRTGKAPTQEKAA
jgi:tetratricopeptide (TPR) repeat protein